MGESPYRATAQSQPNATGAKLMQTTRQDPLYRPSSKDVDRTEIRRLAAKHLRSTAISSSAFHRIGRNRLTRAIDAVLEFIKRYLPPVHWAAIRLLAIFLYGYARAVGATAEIVTVGISPWPDFPKGSVLAIWHGSLPSLLVAFAARRPTVPVKLMVSRDARGDYVAPFCRWLGFDIVRGDAQRGGWEALIGIAGEVHRGAAALISPDGGGPPLVARVGAVALASAAGVPLIPVGAHCRPGIFERHKWDDARNPLPFARIAVACGEPLRFPVLEDGGSLESARKQLQDALNRAANEARNALAPQRAGSAAPPKE